MSKIILIPFIILLNIIPSFAQRTCATMFMDSLRRAKDKSMVTLEEEEKWFQKQITKHKTGPYAKSGVVLRIPVIFHVIHGGQPVGTGLNLSQAQLNSQIDVLNQDFRKMLGTNGYNTNPVGADCEIEFCLANVDPQNNALAEPGIDRINRTSKGWQAPPYSSVYFDSDVKPESFWDPTKYFNIWVSDIYLSFPGDLLGYAQFPDNSGLPGLISGSNGSAATDGIALIYTSVGAYPANPFPGAFNLGRTAVHETGHWLGLRHIWGDANCGDDFCSDTPIHRAANYGCHSHPKSNSCGTHDEMFENYMDYVDDDCFNIFTLDQKDRMRTVLTVSPRRMSLTTSTVCGPPPNCIGFSGNITSTQPVCANNNGTATATHVGGVSPYTYAWSNSATTQTISNLAPGTYIVTIKDVQNCNFIDTVVMVSGMPTAITNATDVTCAGTCNGSGYVTPSGGTAPYTYAWSNNSIGSSINNMCPGNYTVTITDHLNCSIVKNITINPGVTVSVTSSTVNATCNLPNGSATVVPSGGNAPYSFQWSPGANGQTTPTIINVGGGNYSVTVTDANGCSKIQNIYVTNIGGTAVNISNNASVCIGDSVNLAATGGMSYVWSSGETTNNIDILANQNVSYTVTVHDFFNCTIIKNIDVTVNPIPFTNLTANPGIPVCYGAPVQLNAGGGQTYVWSVLGAGTGSNITVYPTSNSSYSVTAYNGGCAGNTSQVNIQVITPAPIAVASADFTHVYVVNGGTVHFNATGSQGNLYQWDFEGDGTYNYSGTNGTTSHNYTNPGAYNAVLKVTLSQCATTDTLVIYVQEKYLGIEEFNDGNGFSIYPNPNEGIFNIKSEGYFGNYEVRIFDGLGQEIFYNKYNASNDHHQKIDLSRFAHGVYIAQFHFDSRIVNQKIMLNR